MSWTTQVTIKFKSDQIMKWDVSGDDGDPICDAVSSSSEWGEFLRWREKIPKSEWSFVLIDQTLLSNKKK